jgi:hypothetical protein
MFARSWLRSRHPSDAGRRARVKPAAVRPRLEALEGRDVPTVWVVTTAAGTGIAGDGSLPDVIFRAQSGDTITFAQNLDGQTITPGTNEEIRIAKNLTIEGPGADLITISGGGPSSGTRVFEIDGATRTVAISGLSIVAGNGAAYAPGANVGWSGGGQTAGTAYDGQGGAVWNGGILTINNCILSGNSADVGLGASPEYEGGAVYNAGTLKVTNSTLQDNSAGDPYGPNTGVGGAVFNTGTFTVINSQVTGNVAENAGGAIFNSSTLVVSGGSISDNSAVVGGGIDNLHKSIATVTGTTLSGNSAYDGGAIWTDGALTLSGCSLNGNSAAHAGGGIYDSKDGHLTIQAKCTVTGNTAAAGADLESLGPVKISKDSTVGVIGP